MLNPLEVCGVGRGGVTAVTPPSQRRFNLDRTGGAFCVGAHNLAALRINE
jgi:hypothetical protein